MHLNHLYQGAIRSHAATAAAVDAADVDHDLVAIRNSLHHVSFGRTRVHENSETKKRLVFPFVFRFHSHSVVFHFLHLCCSVSTEVSSVLSPSPSLWFFVARKMPHESPFITQSPPPPAGSVSAPRFSLVKILSKIYSMSLSRRP